MRCPVCVSRNGDSTDAHVQQELTNASSPQWEHQAEVFLHSEEGIFSAQLLSQGWDSLASLLPPGVCNVEHTNHPIHKCYRFSVSPPHSLCFQALSKQMFSLSSTPFLENIWIVGAEFFQAQRHGSNFFVLPGQPGGPLISGLLCSMAWGKVPMCSVTQYTIVRAPSLMMVETIVSMENEEDFQILCVCWKGWIWNLSFTDKKGERD